MEQKLNITQTSEVKCLNCGCNLFTERLMIRKVSPLLSPTGQTAYLNPFPILICGVCDDVLLEMVPPELRPFIQKKTNTGAKVVPLGAEPYNNTAKNMAAISAMATTDKIDG